MRPTPNVRRNRRSALQENHDAKSDDGLASIMVRAMVDGPLRNALVWLPIAAATALLMDFWAALLHRRIWHTWLWRVHRSHHAPSRGRLEANDVLSFLHAPLAIALLLWGAASRPTVTRELAFGVGLGMSLFGLAYFMVHDGLVHGRLRVGLLLRMPYLQRVVRAHAVHHARIPSGPPYGLFFGPGELARWLRRSRKHGRSTAPMPRGAPKGPDLPEA